MASKDNAESGHQGRVKDPEHDGRLKGHSGSERGGSEKGGAQKASGQKASESHSGDRRSESAHGGGQSSGKQRDDDRGGRQEAAGGDDLKQREYRDKDGNIHHHTKTYMEQHKDEKGGHDR